MNKCKLNIISNNDFIFVVSKNIVPVQAIFHKRSQNGKTNEAKKVYYFLQAFIRKKKDIVPF